jgi:ADP-heptose:LPS heptosyltransferase
MKTIPTMPRPEKEIENLGVEVIEPCTFFSLDRELRIIVLKLDQLGDFILSIPALFLLNEKFKGAAIDIVVGPWNIALAEELKIFRNIYTFHLPEKEWTGVPKEEESLRNDLLKHLGEYDIAVDLRRHRDTRFVLSKISASLKVGYRSFTEFDRDLDICLHTELDEMDIIKRPDRGSMAVQLLNLVEAIPGKSILLPEFLSLPKAGSKIAFFPKAGNGVKEWPLKNYLTLARRIIDENVADGVDFYLGPSDDKISDILENIERSTVHVGLGFKELLNSLSNNSLTVTNDSFGSHLSSYLGIRTVVVFSAREDFREWHPPFGNATIIYSLVSCSPCHLKEISHCPNHLVCLNQISVDLVFETVLKTLQKGFQRRGTSFLL